MADLKSIQVGGQIAMPSQYGRDLSIFKVERLTATTAVNAAAGVIRAWRDSPLNSRDDWLRDRMAELIEAHDAVLAAPAAVPQPQLFADSKGNPMPEGAYGAVPYPQGVEARPNLSAHNHVKAADVGELPPLPISDLVAETSGKDASRSYIVIAYTADQMHDYARAALKGKKP